MLTFKGLAVEVVRSSHPKFLTLYYSISWRLLLHDGCRAADLPIDSAKRSFNL